MEDWFTTEPTSVAAAPPAVLLVRLALALGAGVFVGLERERRGKSGARTFALVCVMGSVAGSLGDAYAWLLFGVVGILVVLLNARQLVQRGEIELTTSAAVFVIAWTGLLFGRGQTFVPVALAVVTAAVLAWKKPLQAFAGGISESEIRSAIGLAVLTLVILPVLPADPGDPWHLVSPRATGFAVALIAGLGWANYLLWRLYGSRGMAVGSLLGGLVNSTAAVAELAQRVRDLGERFLRPAGRGVVLATGAMLGRNAALAALLAPPLLGHIALPVGMMLGAAILVLWRLDTRWLPPGNAGAADTGAMVLGSPFTLAGVLKFGAVFVALQVAGALAQRHAGGAGFLVVSALGGLVSSSSAVAAAASLAAGGGLPVESAAAGTLVATSASAIVNIPLAARFGRNPRLTGVVIRAIVGVVIAGALGWAAQHGLGCVLTGP